MQKKKTDGFTLIELSVVLIIIGLIVGAIVGGQSLIRQAQLRSVISDVRGYITAVNVFQLQYDALPGDMANAQDYWTTCVDSGGNTCNGDGNGRVIWTAGGGESMRFWQHLSLSGILPGNYTGISAGTPVYIRGINIPKSSINNAIYDIWYQTGGLYGKIDNLMAFAELTPAGNDIAGGIITPTEARAIDLKIDDGFSDSGKVMINNGHDGIAWESGCTQNQNNNAPNPLLLNSTTATCRMFFWLE